jgi:hypothetical protein
MEPIVITKTELIHPPLILLEPRDEPIPPEVPVGAINVDGKNVLVIDQVIQWYYEYILKYKEVWMQSEKDKEEAKNYIIETLTRLESETKNESK